MRRLVPALLAVPLLTLLAGCGGSSSKPPADGGTYTTAQTIVDKLNHGGAACTAPIPMPDSAVDGSQSAIQCRSGAGALQDTVAVVFDTHDHALGYASQMLGLGSQLGGMYVLVGVNWAVSTTPAFGPKVAGVLGGSSMH